MKITLKRRVSNMENNTPKDQINLNKEESVTEQQVSTSLSETNSSNGLTNEQKLEYLSKLIQDVEHNLESNGIGKKLVKK